MGIKIVDEGGIIKAKGNPLGSKIGYFFAVLFFIAGGIVIFSGTPAFAIILAGIGIIIASASAAYMYKARIKKLREVEEGYGNVTEEHKGRGKALIIFILLIIVVVIIIVGGFGFTRVLIKHSKT
jgi:uncharacterized iron-regulated membrane protein